MELEPGRTYRQVSSWLKRVDARHNFKISGRDLEVAQHAASILDSSQRDLLVFGTAANGKSGALEGILAASTRSAITLLDTKGGWIENPAGIFAGPDYTRYRSPENIEKWVKDFLGGAAKPTDFVGYDELRQHLSPEFEEALNGVPQRAVVIDAHRPDQALERVALLSSRFKLRNPLIVSSLPSYCDGKYGPPEIIIQRD
jgi:hypothetical protein